MRISAFGILAWVIWFVGLGAAVTRAQDAPQFPGPEKEHEWLEQFVGEWITDSKAKMGPDQPAVEWKGTINSRMIGKFWVVNEMQGDAIGTPMIGLQTIGYDPDKKKYVGTWIDSMANHLWRYEGEVDPSGKKLTLEAEGPNFMTGGRPTKFRDAYEFRAPDHIVITSSMLGDDGQWITFMTGEARRKTAEDGR